MGPRLVTYFQQGSKIVGRGINRNSPAILTSLGVAGLVSTVVLAVAATPKVLLMIEEEEKYAEEYGITNPDGSLTLTKLEIVKLVWKEYIPTALMASATIACIVGSHSISSRRTAALAGLYSLTETSLKEYKEKVRETLGEKKAEKIEDDIAQDKLKSNPVNEKAVVITGRGDFLCYEEYSGRYFRSNIEDIRRTENSFNAKLLREGWMSINQFYDMLGLDDIQTGNEIGWIAQQALVDLRFTTKLAKGDEPCLVLEYRVKPRDI